MRQIYQRCCTALALLAMLGILAGLAGCAEAEAEPGCTDDFECDFGETCNLDNGKCHQIELGRPEPGCTSNDGCAFGEQCNTATGQCQSAQSGNNTSDAELPDAGDSHGTPDAGESDTEEPDPNTCQPACGAGQHCENQACVDDAVDPDVCDPTCGAEEHCENNVCVPNELAACSAQDAPCDPTIVDQGTFWCGQTTDGSGMCLNKCAQELTPIGCSRGEMCLNHGSEAQPALGCISSNCTTDADCAGDNICQQFENEFKGCVEPSLGLNEGESCNVQAAQNPCNDGLVCVEERPGQAFCRSSCSLWTTANGCPAGQVCDVVTDIQGVCTASIDPNASSINGPCSPGYRMCGQSQATGFGVGCFGNTAGSNTCFMYCQVGRGDCSIFNTMTKTYSCEHAGFLASAPSVGVCERIF